MKIKPIHIPGKGWDVTLPDSNMLCDGRAPFTLAQAQVAADHARREQAAKQLFKPSHPCAPPLARMLVN